MGNDVTVIGTVTIFGCLF